MLASESICSMPDVSIQCAPPYSAMFLHGICIWCPLPTGNFGHRHHVICLHAVKVAQLHLAIIIMSPSLLYRRWRRRSFPRRSSPRSASRWTPPTLMYLTMWTRRPLRRAKRTGMHMSGMSCGTGSRSRPSSLRQSALGVQNSSSNSPKRRAQQCSASSAVVGALQAIQLRLHLSTAHVAAAAAHPSSPPTASSSHAVCVRCKVWWCHPN